MPRKSKRFDAGEIAFVVWHEQWDANIHSHADQGVIIVVEGEVGGTATPLLRFNCFDVERSYIYAPEGKNRICRIDPSRTETPSAGRCASSGTGSRGCSRRRATARSPRRWTWSG